MDQKSEKNKRIFQAVVSGVVGLASGVAGGLTKGSNKVEYSFASIFSGINTVANTIDVVKLQSNIKEYKNILNRARSLENKIKEQIDILNKKYRAIQKSDLPDIIYADIDSPINIDSKIIDMNGQPVFRGSISIYIK